MTIIKPIVELVHEYLTFAVKSGDIVVDATAGKGNDTLKLASLVGEKGKVYAFDIQPEALITTKERLQQSGLTSRVKLIAANHKKIADYVNPGITAAVFNLGYLPGGNHEITTNSQDTIEGIKACMTLLNPEGIIIISIYPGHPQGEEERKALANFVNDPLYRQWGVMELTLPNREKAPILLLLEKMKR